MQPLPHSTGLGLKPQHYQHIIEHTPDIGWFEVHPENYMGDGGAPHAYLEKIRASYPLSMHGVGMSLGSIELDEDHLKRVATFIDRYQPEQVSEHLSWSRNDGVFFNDLLPLPYTEESLRIFSENVNRAQERLKCRLLIENPSVYFKFTDADYSETEFLRLLCKKTGCGLLLDLNNVFVSCDNTDAEPAAYLKEYPLENVEEIHLAGHTRATLTQDKTICIDDHGSPVIDPVWDLYAETLNVLGKPVATLIEWDTNVPEFDLLRGEAEKAQDIIQRVTV